MARDALCISLIAIKHTKGATGDTPTPQNQAKLALSMGFNNRTTIGFELMASKTAQLAIKVSYQRIRFCLYNKI
jgi:hypothetical protein